MKVSVYKLLDKGNRYLLINENTKPEDVLSPEIIKKIGKLIFKKTIDIEYGQSRIALDSDEAIKNIDSKGFYFNDVKIEVSIKAE